MKTAKLGAIFMVSVMALAGIGAAYAHWTDMIWIDIKVDMGKLGFGFVSQWTDDPGPNGLDGKVRPPLGPGDGTLDPDCPEGETRECGKAYPPHPDEPKNVASTDCVMKDQKKWHDGTLMEHEGDPVNNTIVVTLDNVYPNYAPNLYFEIANAGTIPVDITGHWLIRGPPGVDPNDPATWIWMDKCTMYQLDLNGDYCPDIEIGLFCNEPDQQIDPCERDEYGLSFHILQCYPQCTTLEFEVKIYGVQWNWPTLI